MKRLTRRAQRRSPTQLSSHHWLEQVLEAALDAVIGMDAAGRITAWNGRAESVFGWPAAQAIGHDLADLIIPPSHRPAHREGLAQFLASGRGRMLGRRVEIAALRQSGEEFPVELTVTALRYGRTWRFCAFVRDLTERWRAGEAHARLAAIVESSSDAITSTNMDGIILSWNTAAERLYGYQAAEAIGRHVSLLVPPDRLQELSSAMHRLAGGERTEFETERMRKGGERLPVSLTISPIRNPQGVVVGVSTIARDNTERTRMERALRDNRHQLQALSRRLVQIQEMERTFLARELHDQIGQTLSAVSVNLESIRRDARDPGVLARVGEGIAAVRRAVEQVQTLSFELRPALLDDLGLAAAIEAYSKRRAGPAGLSVGLTIAVDHPVAADVEAACFRIVQEAVTNVVRHAKATRLDIDLRTEESRLRLAVRDDGVGFDAGGLRATVPVEQRLGLLGMSERAQYVGGELEIESRRGAGALVCARFPLRGGGAGEAR